MHLWLTWSLVLGVAVCLFQIYAVVGHVYSVAIIFTTFICPLWLKWMQRYKLYVSLLSKRHHQTRLMPFCTSDSEINGPWDEAVPAEGRPDTD